MHIASSARGLCRLEYLIEENGSEQAQKTLKTFVLLSRPFHFSLAHGSGVVKAQGLWTPCQAADGAVNSGDLNHALVGLSWMNRQGNRRPSSLHKNPHLVQAGIRRSTSNQLSQVMCRSGRLGTNPLTKLAGETESCSGTENRQRAGHGVRTIVIFVGQIQIARENC